MILGLRVMVVLPAYRAAATLEETLAEIPGEIADDYLIVDAASPDENRGFPGGRWVTCDTGAALSED